MPRVLIVDDEMNIRKLLSGVLADEDYETEAVPSGEEALERLQASGARIDVVLLDLALPGMDGLQVLQEAQKLRVQPVVLMMSGHGTIENAVKATKIGAFDFIQKPLSVPKLLISLENASACSTARVGTPGTPRTTGRSTSHAWRFRSHVAQLQTGYRTRWQSARPASSSRAKTAPARNSWGAAFTPSARAARRLSNGSTAPPSHAT